MYSRQLNGLKKIAILFLALGPNISARVLKHFSESEIERITLEVANTSRVKREKLEAVLDEYFLLHEAQDVYKRQVLPLLILWAIPFLIPSRRRVRSSSVLPRWKNS